MGYQDQYNPFRPLRPNWACRMKPTPDIARLPFKRRYQRQVRQGRRDRYAGPVRAVCGRARSQACREAAPMKRPNARRSGIAHRGDNPREKGSRAMTDVETLKPLADSLDDYAGQIHSIAEIIRHSIELAEDNSDAQRVPHSARGGPDDGQRDHLDSTLPLLKWRPLPLIGETLVVDPVSDASVVDVASVRDASVVDSISPEVLRQRILGPRKGRGTSNRMEAGKTRTT